MTYEIETAAKDDSRIVKVSGAARTGKTEVLVRRTAHLIASGIAPESIWVEVSSRIAGDELRSRLADALEESGVDEGAAARVFIARVADICREVLDDERARPACGRAPRILTGAEYKFLLEDLKTSGMKNRTLRSLLRMFARQWASCEPESSWLAPGEPADIMNLLVSKLRHIDAMVPEELAFRCAEYLKGDEGADARHRFTYVLADDYQNLSRAEQTVVCYCAEKQLVVVGNSNQVTTVNTDHPNAEGFENFDDVRHDVSVHTLKKAFGNGKAIAASAELTRHGDMNRLIAAEIPTDDDMGDPREALVCVKWETPVDEINSMSKYIRDLLDEHSDMTRTYIVVPNRAWLRSAVDACRQRGFKVDTAGMSRGIGGDPRETARARALVAYVKLALLADPESAVAWRCWCGFGNYLLNSDAWMHLEEYADERGLDVVRALSWVSDAVARGEEPFLRCKVLAQAWDTGRSIIERDAKRRGFALMSAIGAEKLPEFADIERLMTGDETAAELFALVYRELTDPHFSIDEHRLRFISLERLCGLSADNIIVLGCVNGFIPNRDAFEVVSTDEDRLSHMNEGRRELASALAKGNRRVVLSYFSKADLELAEKTKLQVARVRSENGVRIALLHPSCFIDEMWKTNPGTTGGQQFLAEHGLA